MTTERNRKTWARVALTRIRLRRALARREKWADAVWTCGALLPGLGAVAFVFGFGDPKSLPQEPLIVAVGLLGLIGFVVTFIGALMGAMAGLMTALLAVVLAPVTLPLDLVHLWRRALRREAERRLWRDGHVPPEWARGRKARRRVLAELAAADRQLRYAPATGLEPVSSGPDEQCRSCGAALRLVGEGVRRCDFCRRDTFGALPERPTEVDATRQRISAVGDGRQLPVSRRALWRRFRAEHGAPVAAARRLVGYLALAYGGAALLSDLGWRFDVEALKLAGAALLVITVLPLFVAIVRLTGRYVDLRFNRFRPGVRAYDRALLGEVVAAVAHQGRIRLEALAAHLGVGVAHIEAVLASLQRLGGVPMLRDRERGELLSLFAAEIGHGVCPHCGGERVPAPAARVVCLHCGRGESAAPAGA